MKPALGFLNVRVKLLLASSLTLLVIFTGMTSYLVQTNTRTLRTNLRTEAQAFAALATAPIGDSYNIYADSGTDQIKKSIDTFLTLNKSITNVAVVDLSGKQLFSYAPGATMVSAAQASSFDRVVIHQGNELSAIVSPYFSTSGGHPFSIVFTVSNAEVDSAIRHEITSLIIFGALLLILTSALTYILINRIIVRPLRDVSRQAELIGAGDLGQQIEVHGRDEIARLGQTVNRMADSLKNSIAQLQEVDKVKSEFMAITSHNLRTPLTIINGYLESIDSFDTVEQLKKALDRIGDSVKRLGSFAEDVLTISSIELGEAAPKAPVAIAAFMQKIIDQTKPVANLRQLTLVTDIKTTAELTISEAYLRSAVWNLIDNAIKFTPANGIITISADQDEAMVHIRITDTGIGIAADEIPKLFTKFHRATSVIKYDYEGTGIGLYATKIIIAQQGGSIDLTSHEGEGSTFTISLPLPADGDVL